ncbi:MAG: formyltransferase family protein [Verrucomicrobia bacterium]|nr:formyltransferase family protein [Verrucomicrobiota bacterium]
MQWLRIRTLFTARRERQKISLSERAIFSATVEALRPHCLVVPEPVENPNSLPVLEEVQRIAPYLLLTLGGPLYSRALLTAARGLAINQHAGWSPDLKGSCTHSFALYHRRSDWLGSTVHLMDTGADSGPILRRSLVAFHAKDTPETLFMKIVALGTELMVECMHDVLANNQVYIFPQPRRGKTVLYSEFTPDIRRAIERDLKGGWLRAAIAAETSF